MILASDVRSALMIESLLRINHASQGLFIEWKHIYEIETDKNACLSIRSAEWTLADICSKYRSLHLSHSTTLTSRLNLTRMCTSINNAKSIDHISWSKQTFHWKWNRVAFLFNHFGQWKHLFVFTTIVKSLVLENEFHHSTIIIICK